MSIEGFLLRMPKVELHVHLEGTFRPATLLELARKNNVPLPANDVEGIRRWFHFPNFERFIEIYVTCSRCLREPEDFYLLAQDFLAEQAMQNVLYSEVHFTISTHVWNGGDPEAIRQALSEATEDAEKRLGVTMRLIPDIVRNMEVERADTTLRWAVDGRDRGVVAIGMGGAEVGYSNDPFVGHFREAREAGLHTVSHAGETGSPADVRSALEDLGAERIGHGVRSIDDPGLMAELAERRIPLEVCPSSNVRLGVAADLASHPFDRLRQAGVEVSLNSDDPPFFDTNLTREYVRMHQTFGYDRTTLAEIARSGLRHAFLTGEERSELERRFDEKMASAMALGGGTG